MLRNKAAYVLTIAAVVALGFISQAVSQETQGTRQGGGRGGPGAGRQAMEDQMKKDLGTTDDEWKALQPKIEKVMTLSFQARGAMMMARMGGRRGGPNAPAAPATDRPQSDVQKKAADLQKVLGNTDSKPEDIKAALTAYRDARTKAREELAKAQKDLREVLTVRQEAVLVDLLD